MALMTFQPKAFVKNDEGAEKSSAETEQLPSGRNFKIGDERYIL